MLFSLSLFLIVSVLFTPAMTFSALQRRVDSSYTTDPSQYYRVAWHSSVLLGETLYRDGGDFTTPSDFETQSQESLDKKFAYPLNSTYSLDLSTSWSPDDVLWNAIDKGSCPVLNRPNLWADPNGKAYYSYNGDVSQAGYYYHDPPPTPELWRFTPDDLKSGSWELVATANSSEQLQSQGSQVTFGDENAYILGGFSNWRTTTVYDYGDESVPVEDIMTYDTEATTWRDRKITDFVPTGWWLDGDLHYVSDLGGVGLVLAMGGTTGLQGIASLAEQSFNTYDRIAFFNPNTGVWRYQTATGEVPSPRRRACSVAVPGDNGTFEIFLHGGSVLPVDNGYNTVPSADIALDQVSVLSLPSFTWYKSSYDSSDARMLHTCHVPGNPTPRRQMIAVGGLAPDLNYSLMTKDPWPQGLGIFDLTELQWKQSYDANAAAYETPKIVKDGIAKNGIYPKSWDDPVVAEWLTGKDLVSPSGSSPSATPTSSSSSAGKTNTGAIAGGVVGGVLGLALLAGLVWFFLRRQRAKKRNTQPGSFEKPELEGASGRGKPWIANRGYSNDSKELGGVAKHEMPGSTGQYEMSAPAGAADIKRKALPTYEMQ